MALYRVTVDYTDATDGEEEYDEVDVEAEDEQDAEKKGVIEVEIRCDVETIDTVQAVKID